MFHTKVVDKTQIAILCSKIFSFENRAGYEIMWNGAGHMTIWRMRIACWIIKATDIHSQYLILIAFQLQQWLRERA